MFISKFCTSSDRCVFYVLYFTYCVTNDKTTCTRTVLYAATLKYAHAYINMHPCTLHIGYKHKHMCVCMYMCVHGIQYSCKHTVGTDICKHMHIDNYILTHINLLSSHSDISIYNINIPENYTPETTIHCLSPSLMCHSFKQTSKKRHNLLGSVNKTKWPIAC